jgi:predicted nucleotidyltransferase
MDETQRRINLAWKVVREYRHQLGEHVVAAACYGSVAHGRADAHSDLELLVLTDMTVEPVNVHTVRDGVAIECDVIPTARLRQAAQLVTLDWGVEADGYRHHYILWDPRDEFVAVREASLQTPAERFDEVLQHSWWSAREWASKVIAMVETANNPGAQYTAWQYLYVASMRVALRQQEPYVSLRTLWQEASARGFGVADMVSVLTGGEISLLPEVLHTVQQHTGVWGAPSNPTAPFVRPK